ncbi:Ankyrin-3 [Durusdinium trenchii]|uniref:Ankyrin-3 n=1 Tax=Durusdinium trenchii TaxID=1381693 RepID=A0ABP0IGH8_9DINO
MGCACSKQQASQPQHVQRPAVQEPDLPRLLGLEAAGMEADDAGAVCGESAKHPAAASSCLAGEEGDIDLGHRSDSCGLRPEQLAAPHVTVEDEGFGVTSSSWLCCAERTPWESELLQVSAELKEKLRDPHFVAMRCDLDSSGDLDAHELKQAARVFGMRPSEEELQQLMANQSRINKERFAEIVREFQQRPGSAKSQRVVPHSLRGMALGQLQHLEKIFVTSGWLGKQCDAFNAENAEAISERKKFQQAPNLYALDNFVVTPMSRPGWCAARFQDWKQTIPWAHVKLGCKRALRCPRARL